MTVKKVLKNIAKVGLIALALRGFFGGIIPPIKYSIYVGEGLAPVDQVFEDHNAYRASFSDANGLVLENRFRVYDDFKKVPKNMPQSVKEKFRYLNSHRYAFVIKDLDPGKRGYVNFVEFKEEMMFFLPHTTYHAEIHIAKDKTIDAGINAVRHGKTTTYENMGEIK